MARSCSAPSAPARPGGDLRRAHGPLCLLVFGPVRRAGRRSPAPQRADTAPAPTTATRPPPRIGGDKWRCGNGSCPLRCGCAMDAVAGSAPDRRSRGWAATNSVAVRNSFTWMSCGSAVPRRGGRDSTRASRASPRAPAHGTACEKGVARYWSSKSFHLAALLARWQYFFRTPPLRSVRLSALHAATTKRSFAPAFSPRPTRPKKRS